MSIPQSILHDDRALGTVVALDVGGTKIAGALVRFYAANLPPVLIGEYSVPTEAQRGGDAVLDTITAVAQRLIDAASPEDTLLGIGAGSAGCVDPATGSISFANDLMPGWTGQPVAEHLQQEFNLPAAVMGDVHAHALGEARWGAARSAQSCLLVAAGTGLGGAYVIDGKVLRGFHGAACHLGHSLHPAAAGIPCACGSYSHVEAVVSGTGIAAQYQGLSIVDKLDPNVNGAVISERANAGEAAALEALQKGGFALGEAIGSWCNIFDPELVIIAGSVIKAGKPWRTALDRGFKAQVLRPLVDIPIINATLGEAAPLIGAAENLRDTL